MKNKWSEKCQNALNVRHERMISGRFLPACFPLYPMFPCMALRCHRSYRMRDCPHPSINPFIAVQSQFLRLGLMASKTSFRGGHSDRPPRTSAAAAGIKRPAFSAAAAGCRLSLPARQPMWSSALHLRLLAVGTADALHHFVSAVGGERYDGGVKQRQYRVG